MAVRVGSGDFVYEVDPDWGRLPDGWAYVDAVGVVVDQSDNVYVFNRGAHPIVVFDQRGKLLGSWGEGSFAGPQKLGFEQPAAGGTRSRENRDLRAIVGSPAGR